MKTLKQAQQKNEQEKEVDTYLESIGVKFSVIGQGVGLKRDGWECDRWSVLFQKGEVQETFEYFTGIGHRVINDREYFTIKNDKGLSHNNKRYRMEKLATPFPPFAAAVLYCLVLDSSGNDQSFNVWCEEYGYSNDSIKAFKTYQQCCETAEKMRKIFTREQAQYISELLQDY